MTLFACANCGQPLTGELGGARPSRDGEQRFGHRIAPPRMARGTYAISDDAAVFALHPDDLPGTAAHPDPGRRNGCCGLDGRDGPNLVCAACGTEVATEQSDCWTQNLVLLTAAVVVGAGSPSWTR